MKKYIGLKKIGDNYGCIKCGNLEFKFCSSFNLTHEHQTNYKCSCGEVATVITEKSADEKAYYGYFEEEVEDD